MPIFLQKIFQLCISSVIFFVFVLYVWQAQLAYEQTTQGIMKATLFAIGIFSGSLSYDITKHLMLLPMSRFWHFFSYIKKLLLHALVLAIWVIISSFLFAQESFESKYWGFWIYLLALAQVYWVLKNVENAINAARL